MNWVPLLDVAPLATDRVRRFAGERPYIATGSLDDNGALSPEMVSYETRPDRADQCVRASDVCMARMQATQKVFLFNSSHSDLVLSTGFAVFRPIPDKLLARFLFHYARTDWFQKAKDALCSGATQKAITNEKIATLMIPLPPLNVQRRIAELLDTAETVRAQRRTALAQLDVLAEAMFLDMFGNPLINDRSWPTCGLADVACVERGRFTPRPRNDPTYYDGPYPFIQTGDISRSGGRVTSWTQSLNEKGAAVSRSFPAGTVVIAIVGATLGMTAILDEEVYCPDSVVGIQAYPKKACGEYIERVLRFWRPIFVAQAPETARANINLGVLRPLKIPMPPVTLQLEFRQRIKEVERLRTEQRTSLAELDALFASLQHRAFRGEL